MRTNSLNGTFILTKGTDGDNGETRCIVYKDNWISFSYYNSDVVKNSRSHLLIENCHVLRGQHFEKSIGPATVVLHLTCV